MPVARRRMRRRRVGRAVVGTAVVAGTAGVVRHHQNKKYAEQDQQQAVEQEAYVEPAPEQQYAPPPAPEEDMITQLERLAALRDQGILTEEEFAAQKAKLLAA